MTTVANLRDMNPLALEAIEGQNVLVAEFLKQHIGERFTVRQVQELLCIRNPSSCQTMLRNCRKAQFGWMNVQSEFVGNDCLYWLEPGIYKPRLVMQPRSLVEFKVCQYKWKKPVWLFVRFKSPRGPKKQTYAKGLIKELEITGLEFSFVTENYHAQSYLISDVLEMRVYKQEKKRDEHTAHDIKP